MMDSLYLIPASEIKAFTNVTSQLLMLSSILENMCLIPYELKLW